MDRRGFLIAASSLPLLAWSRSVNAAGPDALDGWLATRWDQNRWSRGSYSALPVGVNPDVRQVLADAVIGGRVTLAGEYASTQFPSTTTGAYLSGRRAARRLLQRVDARRAVVIGAGLAGAAAAAEFSASGVSVTVLEARSRIGGRIHSDRTWGEPIELGAAWIHGVRDNPLVPLARAAGLRLVPTDYDDAVVRDTMTGRVSAVADRRWNRLSRLTEPLASRCRPVEMSVADYLRDRGWRADRIDSWAEQVEITQEYGLDPDRLGVRAYCEGADYRGGDVMVVGGYDRIPAALLANADVQVSTPVTKVAVRGGSVTVRMESGNRIEADVAVVAVPLPLLKDRFPLIEPMPRQVRRAAGLLATGVLEKVVLRYDETWWGSRQVYGIVGGGAPDAPAGSAAALRWTEFYSLTKLGGIPALVGFAGGSAARRRPRSQIACAHEASAALHAAFSR